MMYLDRRTESYLSDGSSFATS